MKLHLKSKLFHKYFLLFTANLIFFILILSYLVYFVFVRDFLQKQFFQANVNNLGNVSKSVEYFLKKADDVAKYYSLLDKEAMSYQYKNIGFGSSFLDFVDRLRVQNRTDGSIQSVYLYYLKQNKLIDVNASGVYTVRDNGPDNRYLTKDNFYDTGWLAALKAGRFNQYGFILADTRPLYIVKDMDNLSVHDKNTLSHYPNKDVITIIRAFENRQENSNGVVVVNLNESVLSNYLKNAYADSPQTSFIINTGGHIVSYDDKSFLNKDLSGSSYIQTITGSEEDRGFFVDKVDGQKSAVIYTKSSYINWIYISVVPYSYIINDLNYITGIVLIVIFLILISAVVSVYILTKRIYSPIERIFNKIKGISRDAKTAMQKSEVKVIESLLDKFKQNYDHLDKLVLDNYYLLKYGFLNKMVLGECDLETRKKGIEEYKLCFDREFFTVITMEIDNFFMVLKDYKVRDIYLMKCAVINIAEEILNAQYAAVGTDISQKQISIILNTDKRPFDKNVLNESLRNIADLIHKYFNISISIGIGGVYYSPEELKHSYEEACRALQNKLHKGKSAIIYYDEISVNNEYYKYTGFDDQLLNFIKTGQKDRCVHTLNDMIMTISENNTDRLLVKNIFMESVLLIHKLLSNATKSFEEICGCKVSEILGFIDTVETLDELKDYMENIFAKFCDYYAYNRKNQNEELVYRVMSYIEQHYYKELTLDGIASTLKLTPQYISKLIKDITGVNFIDHLTGVRIKKSEQLLLKSDIPVQEVAEKVGYVCYRTYLKHFKDYTGMIPTQYRKFNNTACFKAALQGPSDSILTQKTSGPNHDRSNS